MARSEVMFPQATVLRGEVPEHFSDAFSGYGDGSGYGYGSGSGYGYGYGDGSGYGDGYKKTWLAAAKESIQKWTDSAQQRIAELMKSPDVVLAFWKSGADGLPANGGKCKTPAYPGMVQEEKGPLRICTSEALHATMVPDEWSGDRVWIVALHGEVQFQENKCASLRREIIGEVFP